MIQTYDIGRSWGHNYRAGPRLEGVEVRVPATTAGRCFGYPVNSRLGIAAGLLLNSRWLLAYARLGYDLLTYKTVRSVARPAHPLPNWVFLAETESETGPVYAAANPGEDRSRVSSSVCFGMPSVSPADWRADVAVAREGLLPGQVLIVSVVASPQPGWDLRQIAEDYARCAAWAVAAGAQIVEANLSCPNVCSAEGSLYRDAEASRIVAETLRERIGDCPLLLKIGHFSRRNALDEFLRRVDRIADGVTLVNGLTRPVLTQDGNPMFGEACRTAGVLGRTIHPAAVDQVRQAGRTIRDENLSLNLWAVGGASALPDIRDFFSAGAQAVMLGSSPMYHPALAAEYKRKLIRNAPDGQAAES